MNIVCNSLVLVCVLIYLFVCRKYCVSLVTKLKYSCIHVYFYATMII